MGKSVRRKPPAGPAYTSAEFFDPTLSNQSPYRINPVAFSDHAANFRLELINSLFTRLGVDGITNRLRHSATFARIFPGNFT